MNQEAGREIKQVGEEQKKSEATCSHMNQMLARTILNRTLAEKKRVLPQRLEREVCRRCGGRVSHVGSNGRRLHHAGGGGEATVRSQLIFETGNKI
jgi:hypothetical protein